MKEVEFRCLRCHKTTPVVEAVLKAEGGFAYFAFDFHDVLTVTCAHCKAQLTWESRFTEE